MEISELDAFRRTDVARIKQFLSLRTDRFRAAYGRHVKELPRCCVFFGTTNTKAWPFDMVVLDESTSFKNSQSKRFKAMRRVRRFIKRMVLLTGTPSSKGLIDLWAQVYLLDGGERLGPSLSAYRERYFDPDQRSRTQIFSYKAKDGAESAVLAAISDICISMKAEDYLQLPDFIQHEIPVILDFFDDVLGEGKADELFGKRVNVKAIFDGYREFTTQVNGCIRDYSKNISTAQTTAVVPLNRAQRRRR